MLAEFALFPLGGEHLSEEVAKAVEELEASGLNFRVGPMGTTVEGDSKVVFDAIHKCYDRIARDHERVIMTITVDGRKSNQHPIAEMVPTVQKKLKHPLPESRLEMAGKYLHVSRS